MSYRFLLFPEDKTVLLHDILSMNKWYVMVTENFNSDTLKDHGNSYNELE